MQIQSLRVSPLQGLIVFTNQTGRTGLKCLFFSSQSEARRIVLEIAGDKDEHFEDCMASIARSQMPEHSPKKSVMFVGVAAFNIATMAQYGAQASSLNSHNVEELLPRGQVHGLIRPKDVKIPSGAIITWCGPESTDEEHIAACYSQSHVIDLFDTHLGWHTPEQTVQIMRSVIPFLPLTSAHERVVASGDVVKLTSASHALGQLMSGLTA